MAKPELINLVAEAAYERICDRAKEMVKEALPNANEMQRICLEAGIAAGVTAALKTLHEAGVLT